MIAALSSSHAMNRREKPDLMTIGIPVPSRTNADTAAQGNGINRFSAIQLRS
jgi:hypothetical protein